MSTQAIQKLERPAVVTPSASEFAVMKETAKMLVSTKFLPQAIQTPEQAIAIILTGRELGIGTMAALNTINVIQGKPTVSPQLMLALIERSGQLTDIQIEVEGGAVRCTMKRKGRSPHTEVFGENEAKAMGLMNKDNYKKQPLTMYRWRAVAACARTVFPDVILGLYTPDEMGAETDEEGGALPAARPTVVDIDRQGAASATEPENQECERLRSEIAAVCKTLNERGDSIIWTRTSLVEYAAELFGDETVKDTDQLDEENLRYLAEDLGERLKQIEATIDN